MNYFILDDIPSSDYNVVISGESTWGAPERDIETIEVPGRNGALFVDNNRFKNVTFEMSCAILDSWRRDFPAFKAKLLSHMTKYYRYVDTYHPNEYLMARVSAVTDISYDALINTGTFKIQFDRKPQRFLKDVDPIVFTSSGTIFNPTDFPSKPIIRIWGMGAFGIGGDYYVGLTNNDSYIDLDTENLIAYRDRINQNGCLTQLDDEICINPGLQAIEIDPDGITKLEITPRWWTV